MYSKQFTTGCVGQQALSLLLLPVFIMSAVSCTKVESNVALGTLERDRITLSATAAELIIAQPVKEGSHVATGDLLVQLDTTLQQFAVRKIEADIQQQLANLDKLHNGPRLEEIAAAQARVETAQAIQKENQQDLQRISDLVSKQLAARADQDTAVTRLESNAARVRDAQAQLQLLRSGSRSEDIAQAEALLVATRVLLASEQQKLSNLSIVATRAGILDTLPFNIGERVALGSQLVVLLSDDPPYARVYIPETSRAAITTGDMLTVHVDGAQSSFSGTVRWISQEPAFTPYYALNSSERSRLVYLAEVQLPINANSLPAGLPLQVELP